MRAIAALICFSALAEGWDLRVPSQAVNTYRAGDPNLQLPKLVHSIVPPDSDGPPGAKYREVEMSVIVAEDGTVRSPQVVRSIDRQRGGLDQQALAAVRQWKFEPGRRGAGPVRVEAICVVGFGDRKTLFIAGARERTPDEEVFAPGIPFAFRDPGIVPPALRVRYDPGYTVDMLRRRIRGHVELQLIVLADGSVGRTRIVKSLDPVPGGADDLARFAAASAVFAPATREGQPIDVLLNFETSFITR